MKYRDKEVDVSMFRTNILAQNTRFVVAEPGDATRYEILVTYLDPMVAKASHQHKNSMVVTCLNLSGEPQSMFVTPGKLHWKDVRDGLKIYAEGSCYFITVLLAYMHPHYTCQSEEEFNESYKAWLKKTTKS